MAGTIVISSIQLDSGNDFTIVSNTGTTLVSANGSGLNVSTSLASNSITSDKIVSVANTKISGNIVSSQITSVANTQLTGTVTNAQVGASVYEGIGYRNRIINGDMRVDQRNAGASLTVNTADAYFPVDRFRGEGTSSDGVFTVQRDTSAPVGFVNSVKVTITTADASIGASQRYQFIQRIEGNNIADLGFGTANAKTTTLSFWVRSSLTGTFGGSYRNNTVTRSYPFSYTISAADTWEYKTVTIAGDTSGTWETGTDTGLILTWSLGSGTNFQGTAGAWNGNNNNTVTGETQLIANNAATWYITGVQLEVGSVATPFERRPYGTELALCQRYFETFGLSSTSLIGSSYSTTAAITILQWKVTKRVSPTITLPAAGQTSGTVSFLAANSNYPATTGTHVTAGITVDKAYIEGSSYAGLTLGASSTFYSNGTSTIQISAEL
jgi:hypothetical protein